MQGGGQESGEPEIPKARTDPALSMVLTSLWVLGCRRGGPPTLWDSSSGPSLAPYPVSSLFKGFRGWEDLGSGQQLEPDLTKSGHQRLSRE